MDRLSRLKSSLSSVHHSFTYYERGDSISSLLKKHLPFNEFNEEGIYVNGRAFLYDFSPITPVKIEYFERKKSDLDIKISVDHIVYQDEFFLIVYKPKGLSTLPTREKKTINLKHKMQELLETTVHLPSRLDTSTEGLVVMSKNPAYHNALQDLFVKREIHKYYIFETANRVSWQEKSVLLPIVKDSLHPILRTVSRRGNKPARTDFTFYPINERYFVLAKPFTGRTHQIRVHAFASGISIIGDNFYEGAFCQDGLRLMSYLVQFDHPVTKEPIKIMAPEKFWPTWATPLLEHLKAGAEEAHPVRY